MVDKEASFSAYNVPSVLSAAEATGRVCKAQILVVGERESPGGGLLYGFSPAPTHALQQWQRAVQNSQQPLQGTFTPSQVASPSSEAWGLEPLQRNQFCWPLLVTPVSADPDVSSRLPLALPAGGSEASPQPFVLRASLMIENYPEHKRAFVYVCFRPQL